MQLFAKTIENQYNLNLSLTSHRLYDTCLEYATLHILGTVEEIAEEILLCE